MDTSHLVAIHERLSRQKADLASDPSNKLLAVWVAQTEKEFAAELQHLGMNSYDDSTDLLSDDALLDALND